MPQAFVSKVLEKCWSRCARRARVLLSKLGRNRACVAGSDCALTKANHEGSADLLKTAALVRMDAAIGGLKNMRKPEIAAPAHRLKTQLTVISTVQNQTSTDHELTAGSGPIPVPLPPRLTRKDATTCAVRVPACFISRADVRLAPDRGGLLWHMLVDVAFLELPGLGPRFLEWPDGILAAVVCPELGLPDAEALWAAYCTARNQAELLAMEVGDGVKSAH